MGDYGPNGRLVRQLIAEVGELSLEDAADLYRAHGARLIRQGSDPQRRAVREAARIASRIGRTPEYEAARRDAAMAFRHALPVTQGPWILVSQAVTNAAGALVLADVLDKEPLLVLIGPWRQVFGSLTPVGPGGGVPALAGDRN